MGVFIRVGFMVPLKMDSQSGMALVSELARLLRFQLLETSSLQGTEYDFQNVST